MGVKDRSFWKGATRGFEKTYGPSMNDVMQSELAKRVFKHNRNLINIEEEEENRSESKSLQESIIGDTSLTPEERAQFASQFGDGKKGLSKADRDRIYGSYNTYKTDKKKASDKTAEKETAAAEKKAAAKMKFDALKAEAEALGPEAAKSMAGYMSMAEPNEVAVDRFEKAIEREYTKSKEETQFQRQQSLKGADDKVAAADRPKTAKELLSDAVKYAEEKETAVTNLVNGWVTGNVIAKEDAESARGDARKLLQLPPAQQSLVIDYLQKQGRMFNPAVADSLVAALNDPNVAPAGPAAAVPAPDMAAPAAAAPAGQPTGVDIGKMMGGGGPVPPQPNNGQPTPGVVSPQQEAAIKEREARIDALLKKLEEQL